MRKLLLVVLLVLAGCTNPWDREWVKPGVPAEEARKARYECISEVQRSEISLSEPFIECMESQGYRMVK